MNASRSLIPHLAFFLSPALGFGVGILCVLAPALLVQLTFFFCISSLTLSVLFLLGSRSKHDRLPHLKLHADSRAWLSWFRAHNLLWFCVGNALMFFLLWFFGPLPVMPAICAGLACVSALVVPGLRASANRNLLGLCWQTPVSVAWSSFFADASRILLASHRFRSAVLFDKTRTTPLLPAMTRILDQADSGGSARSMALRVAPTSGFSQELLARCRILGVTFCAVILLWSLTALLLPIQNVATWPATWHLEPVPVLPAFSADPTPGSTAVASHSGRNEPRSTNRQPAEMTPNAMQDTHKNAGPSPAGTQNANRSDAPDNANGANSPETQASAMGQALSQAGSAQAENRNQTDKAPPDTNNLKPLPQTPADRTPATMPQTARETTATPQAGHQEPQKKQNAETTQKPEAAGSRPQPQNGSPSDDQPKKGQGLPMDAEGKGRGKGGESPQPGATPTGQGTNSDSPNQSADGQSAGGGKTDRHDSSSSQNAAAGASPSPSQGTPSPGAAGGETASTRASSPSGKQGGRGAASSGAGNRAGRGTGQAAPLMPGDSPAIRLELPPLSSNGQQGKPTEDRSQSSQEPQQPAKAEPWRQAQRNQTEAIQPRAEQPLPNWISGLLEKKDGPKKDSP